MDKQVDNTALNWVKQEIDETLGQACLALEEYAADPDDTIQLQCCSNYIHQVYGALQMVELYGVALFSEELEKLALALLDNNITQKEDACALLMQGIIQLPEYLERIQAGLVDNPLILLPLLNDIRAVRGEHLMSESSLFNPDILSAGSIVLTGCGMHAGPDGCQNIQQLAKKMRHQFHAGLLGWFRNRNLDKSLQNLADVLGQLERVCTCDPVIRLWWVAAGLIEALIEEGVQSSVSIKLLVGQLDREIKRLIDEGEQALAEHPSEALLKNLLYYVACSSSSGIRVSEVKNKFNLFGVLPDQKDIDMARESISAPSARIMEAITREIKEDLANVKDALDLFLRTDKPNISLLEPQVEVLRRVADTLAMLGLGVSRKIVQEQSEKISNFLAGNDEANEASLIKIAGSLLYVESSLERLSEIGASRQMQGGQAPPEDGSGEHLPESEIQKIRSKVLWETGVVISHAKDAITSYLDASMDCALLASVPEMLDQARGGLSMIAEDHATSLLHAVNQYISIELIENKQRPDQIQLDALADAISCIEYYLEAVLEGRLNKSFIMIVADDALEKLGYPIGIPEDLILSDRKVQATIPPLRQFEDNPVIPFETDTSNVWPPKENTQDDLVDEIDEEILDVFIEEADEELVVINELLPKWKNNLSDDDALTRIRRAFHTMKGSGRMVGAFVIGELAWAIENMLNRILDNTIQVSDEMVTLMDEVVMELPGLVGQLKEKTGADSENIQAMVNRALSLVESGKVGLAEVSKNTDLQVQETIQKQDKKDGLQGARTGTDVMDPALYDVFTKESKAHLEELRRYIGVCKESHEDCVITDAVVRALHTLHGSACMADSTNIAELSRSLERYFKLLMDNHCILPEYGMNILVDGVKVIEQMLGQISNVQVYSPEISTEDYCELLGKLDILYSHELKEQEKQQQHAHAEAEAEAEDELDNEGYDEELLEAFLEEGEELLDAGELLLQRWGEDLQNLEHVVKLQRDIHTLKGSARMAGVTEIGNLSHAMESLVEAVVDGRREVTHGVVNALHITLDSLLAMLQQTKQGQSREPATDLIDRLDMLQQGKVDTIERRARSRDQEPQENAEVDMATIETQPDKQLLEQAHERVSEPEPVQQLESWAEQEHENTGRKEVVQGTMVEIPPPTKTEEQVQTGAVSHGREDRVQQEVMRIRADLLDNLVNHAGEVSIYRSRLEQQVGAFGFNLDELDQTVVRLREQLRKLEIETETQILFRYEDSGNKDENFDPLELDRYSHIQQLSRSLIESTSDISSIKGILDNLVRESQTLLIQQARVNTELQEGLMRARMVSFTSLVPRLQRISRQISQELGKKTRLDLVGEQGEMDRSVLERVTAPLEHMIRNAISHGIESPEERKKRGKNSTGVITISVTREASEIVIAVSDDGGGIDLDAIRNKAVESGVVDSSSCPGEYDLMQFVLESGFSTAAEVTQISGRGVGMDVVNSEVKQLGGSIHIGSTPGQGSTFTIRLPFTLAINHALLVNAGDDAYAIPLSSIEGIVRMTSQELEHFYSDEVVRYPYAGHEYQVRELSCMLGFPSSRHDSGKKVFPVLLVRTGDTHMAVQVDSLMGSREIVVKPVGPQISSLPGISGATILGDGSVVLILDINSLMRPGEIFRMDSVPDKLSTAESEKSQIMVMVVDDSITVRKVTTRLLERNNIKVVTAKDGVDAMTLLNDQIPDVMLLDIEMPRMDGYELATYMRNEERLENIPIIMITSRTGDKHRRRAEEIGVNRYMGKPYQESELLENIEQLLEESRQDENRLGKKHANV